MDDTEAIIVRFLADQPRVTVEMMDRLGPDTPLLEGYLDSLALLDLVTELESRLGLELDFEDVEPATWTTIAGLCALVRSRRA